MSFVGNFILNTSCNFFLCFILTSFRNIKCSIFAVESVLLRTGICYLFVCEPKELAQMHACDCDRHPVYGNKCFARRAIHVCYKIFCVMLKEASF